VVSAGRVVCGNEQNWSVFLRSLSFHDLSKLGVLQKQIFNVKYPSSSYKPNLSRNVYRVFSDNDLLKFFSVVKQKEVKQGLAFFLQATCGFRIGEIVGIKVQDIDFERGVISLHEQKAGKISSDQPAPFVCLDLLESWIETNDKQVAEHKDFVFFSGNPLFQRDSIDVNSFRNYFQRFRKRAGLDQTYAERNDSANPKHQTNRPLYKLTSHGFRRSYGTRLYTECKQRELIKTLLRHKKKESVDAYIQFSHQQQIELVNKVFNREPFTTIATDLKEKICLR
tara:strand:- start:821 stop:1663 length:843 start_codon:yes stop_codon:yes gene_type:complete